MTAKRQRIVRKTPPGVKPKPRCLNATQMVEHRAMITKVQEMRLLVAQAEAIQAEWKLYGLRLNRELGLREGESITEDGRIVVDEG